MLLSHLDKLPPAVQDYWKTSFGLSPAASDAKKEPESKEVKGKQKHGHD